MHACPVKQIRIFKNADYEFDVWLRDCNTGIPVVLDPYLLAASGDIHAILLKESGEKIVKTLSASGGITVINSGGGGFTVSGSAEEAESMGITDGTYGDLEIELLTAASGSNQTVTVAQFLKSIEVLPRIGGE